MTVKKNLVLTSAALEQVLKHGIQLVPEYELYTTDVVNSSSYANNSCSESLHIQIFSDKEMESFAEFFYANVSLQAIGFKDATAVFCALYHKFALVVADEISERICEFLNVETVSLGKVLKVNEDSSLPKFDKSQTDSDFCGMFEQNKNRRLMTG